MKLADGSIIMHAGEPYDPVKAHEYYLRTRKLIGRKSGGSYTVTTSSGHTVKLSAQKLAEQKVYAAHQVQRMKQNLHDLNVLLKEKLQKAKEAEKTSAKPPSLAEKAKAARDAEAYRKSHKQVLKNKAATAASKAPATPAKPAGKADTVDSLKKEIVTTRANLKAAVAKQRELATAKKNG